MPVLTPLPDGRYSVSLFLPIGAEIEYKYTLGDGFWNSEFTSTGQYVTRHVIVPAQNMTVEDIVQSWQSGPDSPILFQVTVPQNTHRGHHLYSVQSLWLDTAHPQTGRFNGRTNSMVPLISSGHSVTAIAVMHNVT